MNLIASAYIGNDPDNYDVRPYEPEVVDVIKKFLVPGDLVIDAGASIGNHTPLMSKLVGEIGIVLAFEPHRESFNQLLRTTKGLNNVLRYKRALWNHQCKMQLWSMDEMGYSSFHKYDPANHSEMVDCFAIDLILLGLPQPRLIKIDCEGAEEEILRGAEKTLRRGVDAVVVELNFQLFELMGRTDHTIRNYMAELGYDMFVIGNFPPIMVMPAVEMKLVGGRHINVLFTHEHKVWSRWYAHAP